MQASERIDNAAHIKHEIDGGHIGIIVQFLLDRRHRADSARHEIEIAPRGLRAEPPCMKPDHAEDRLQIVLHAVMHFRHQHIALAEGGLDLRAETEHGFARLEFVRDVDGTARIADDLALFHDGARFVAHLAPGAILAPFPGDEAENRAFTQCRVKCVAAVVGIVGMQVMGGCCGLVTG